MKNNIEKNSNTFDGFIGRVWVSCEPIIIDTITEVSREAKEFIVVNVKKFFENLKNK